MLTFHGVPALEHPWVNTQPDVFERMMCHLHDNGYTVAALRDLIRYIDPKAGGRHVYSESGNST